MALRRDHVAAIWAVIHDRARALRSAGGVSCDSSAGGEFQGLGKQNIGIEAGLQSHWRTTLRSLMGLASQIGFAARHHRAWRRRPQWSYFRASAAADSRRHCWGRAGDVRHPRPSSRGAARFAAVARWHLAQLRQPRCDVLVAAYNVRENTNASILSKRLRDK